MSALRGRKGPALSHRYGGGGRQTHIICGRFTADEREGTPALWRQLPALLHLRRERFAELVAFSRTFDLLGQELRGGAPGADRAAALLTETLLIHVLRAVLAQADEAPIGWMAGLRDPQIGATLALIHAEPQKRWSLESLARRAGLSRAAFAKRFHDKVGVPPMAYLATWRLQLAARWLRESGLSISEILGRLGYGSAASFHRAFKAKYGLSPSAYRQAQAASPPGPAIRHA
jgi:AraC-like DNA-binding protein